MSPRELHYNSDHTPIEGDVREAAVGDIDLESLRAWRLAADGMQDVHPHGS